MRHRKYRIVFLFALVALVGIGLAVRSGVVRSRHVIREGITHELVAFQMRLWDYTRAHGHAPRDLVELIPSAPDKNRYRYRTLQHVRCDLVYYSDPAPNAPAVRVVCGDPVMVEYDLDAEGQVIRQVRHHPDWWLMLRQRRSDAPKLTDMLRK